MDHRCFRGAHCPDWETLDDATRAGRRINSAEGLCDTCQRHVHRAITSLPTDYVELDLILGKGSSVGGEPIRMTRDLPVPIRLHIEAQQREMVTESDLWAASVAAVLGIPWTTSGPVRPGWTLDRACALLARSPSAFLALRDVEHDRWESDHFATVTRTGLDGAVELLRLHHRARTFLGQTRLVHHLPVPCPRCEAMALMREDGQDAIDCGSCARRYTWDEYEKLCLILAGRHESAA